jgi:predicted deacylase
MSRLWAAALLLAFTSRSAAALTASSLEAKLGYFPESYDQSRDRFRAAVAAKANQGGGIMPPFAISNPAGEDLTIDHALFSRGGDRLLVVQSGIHGSEAASGAAVQMFLLDQHLDALLSRGIDVYLIHALNPWGFKHDRRTDHKNINLNRNFSIDGTVYLTPSPDYRRFRTIFEPTEPVSSDWINSFTGDAKLLANLVADGFSSRSIIDGLDNGQYEFPQGLNYGGREPALQTGFLRGQLAALLARPYKKVLFLDFHTGLGKAGILAVIKGKNPSPALMAEMSALLDQQDGIEISSAETPGFFATSGDVIDFVPSLAPNPRQVLAVTMEYGTLGSDMLSQLKSAQRLILENQNFFHGSASPSVEAAVKRNFAELFNPSDPGWRRKVMDRANRVFSQLAGKF